MVIQLRRSCFRRCDSERGGARAAGKSGGGFAGASRGTRLVRPHTRCAWLSSHSPPRWLCQGPSVPAFGLGAALDPWELVNTQLRARRRCQPVWRRATRLGAHSGLARFAFGSRSRPRRGGQAQGTLDWPYAPRRAARRTALRWPCADARRRRTAAHFASRSAPRVDSRLSREKEARSASSRLPWPAGRRADEQAIGEGRSRAPSNKQQS